MILVGLLFVFLINFLLIYPHLHLHYLLLVLHFGYYKIKNITLTISN